MGSLIERKKRILLNEPHIDTVSGGVANFSTDLVAPLKSCKVEFSPVQSGTGDPSPTNIRPITGWTGVNVIRCGKNLFDISSYPLENNYYINGNTGARAESTSNAYACMTLFIPISNLQGKTVTLNKRPGGNNPGIAFYSSNSASAFISGIKNNGATAGTPWTFEIPTNATHMRFSVPMGATEIQLELGTSSTAYEPFKPITTYPISWTDKGTVYGGHVDLVTGELAVTCFLYTFDSSNANTFSDFYGATGSKPRIARYNFNMGIPYKEGDPQGVIMSDKALTYPNGMTQDGDNSKVPYVAMMSSNQGFQLVFPVSYNITTLQEARNWIINNPISMVFRYVTPHTYQLTPQQIKTLRDTNNIWSNANGNTTVKYWKH